MNSNLTVTGNSSHQTVAVAHRHHISTVDELIKRALFIFKLEIFTKVLKKDKSYANDYDIDSGLRLLGQKAIKGQKDLLESNILSYDNDMD